MFLPPIERSGEIKFYILKSLPYYPRLYLTIGLLILGFGLQVLTLSVSPGIFFILGAMYMGLAAGYTSSPSLGGSTFWKEVDWTAFEEIVKTSERNKRWDVAWLDITNLRGLILFALVAGHAVALYHFLAPQAERLVLIYSCDVLALAIPLWFTGVRSKFTNDKVVVKVEEFLAIRRRYEKVLRENGDIFVPMLEITPVDTDTSLQETPEGLDQEVPTDAQLRVQFEDMHRDYYGLQAQVTINEVQGKKYPYFYCVLVAKKGTVDWQEFKEVDSGRIVVEFQGQRDVEVLVIRQRTTKNSGYHVERRAADRIFSGAYKWGRSINDSLK